MQLLWYASDVADNWMFSSYTVARSCLRCFNAVLGPRGFEGKQRVQKHDILRMINLVEPSKS